MANAVNEQVRDLEADLAICEAAAPDIKVILESRIPLYYNGHKLTDKDRQRIVEMLGVIFSEYSKIKGDRECIGPANFITEAREGWPYAIRRALDAEAEVDKLRNELNILQERFEYYSGRCFD
jgi:hypothetical protein